MRKNDKESSHRCRLVHFSLGYTQLLSSRVSSKVNYSFVDHNFLVNWSEFNVWFRLEFWTGHRHVFLWHLSFGTCCAVTVWVLGVRLSLSGDGLAITSARTNHHGFHTLCTTTYTKILLCRSRWGRFQCRRSEGSVPNGIAPMTHYINKEEEISRKKGKGWEKEGERMDLGFCSYTTDGVGQCILCQSRFLVSRGTNTIIKPSHSIGFRNIGREKQTLVGGGERKNRHVTFNL